VSRPDPADAIPDAGIAEGRTTRQQGIAALVQQAVITHGVDFGSADGDIVSVHCETIGYHIIDILHEHGLAITRRR
jgi:hypothetical protein